MMGDYVEQPETNPVSDRRQFYKGIQMAIRAEGNWPSDVVGQEDEMFYRLGELAADELINAQEAHECFSDFIGQLRPDTHVLKCSPGVQLPSERSRFYE